MTKGPKIIIGVVVALIILSITCIGGFFAFGIWVVNQTPEGIVLTFDTPDTITVGDEFHLIITVDNLLDEPRTLNDLSFYSPILDGVTILSTDPAANTDDGTYILGSRALAFNRIIPAEGQLVLDFTMTAEQSGFYTGDVDITIDSLFAIFTTTQTIVIEE